MEPLVSCLSWTSTPISAALIGLCEVKNNERVSSLEGNVFRETGGNWRRVVESRYDQSTSYTCMKISKNKE